LFAIWESLKRTCSYFNYFSPRGVTAAIGPRRLIFEVSGYTQLDTCTR